MSITAPKQTELFSKLLTLARGDMELVQEAIRNSVPAGGKAADLKQIVAFILARMQQDTTRAA
ncbi:hypothetical protein ACLBXM_08510 [Xanthobacteraceae bacterium A53D]